MFSGGVHADIGFKNQTTRRTHSQPGLHSAISNWAHTPEAKREASGMTFERNPRAIAIGGSGSTTELEERDGGGRGR